MSRSTNAAQGGDVVQLHGRKTYSPDLGALARQQVAAARRQLGVSAAEFATLLSSLLGWTPSAETVESWETSVVPPGDVLLAVGAATQVAVRDHDDAPGPDLLDQLVGRRFADVEAVYPSRAEFISQMPPRELFAGASEIRLAGLSLNYLCQQYPTDDLARLLEAGCTVDCLFLDPNGHATALREAEEGYQPGRLGGLTDLNIMTLQRLRDGLAPEHRARLQLATYDEIVRFNLTFINGTTAVVQPYLYGVRGVEAPTFVLHRRGSATGLYPMFERTFEELWQRGTEL